MDLTQKTSPGKLNPITCRLRMNLLLSAHLLIRRRDGGLGSHRRTRPVPAGASSGVPEPRAPSVGRWPERRCDLASGVPDEPPDPPRASLARV